jgi:hypothetical protein
MKLLTGPASASGNRRAFLLLAGGAALAATLWVLSEPPAPEVVEPVAAAQRTSPRGDASHAAAPIGFATRKIASVSTDLFGSHSWYVPPPPPPAAPVRAPPPPTAPTLPFSMLGSYESAGGAPVYFLVRGDRVYDVHVGDVIDNTYSVDGVSNGQLNLTYLPLNIRQSLPVEGGS